MSGAAAAIDRIPPGSRVVAAPACGTPTGLVDALATRSDGLDRSLRMGLLFEPGAVAAAAERDGALRLATWHVTAGLEPLVRSGRIDHVPLRASRVPAHLEGTGVDVALVRVTPPDRHGWCSLGPSVSYVLAALRLARLVVAEVDPDLPRTWGRSHVHVSELDLAIDATGPAPTYEAGAPTPVSRAIARHVLDLLPERPVLQLGIGAVPEALIDSLAEFGVGSLRFTGMGCDGMVALAEHGLLDLTADDGLPAISAPDLLGTALLMRFADGNPTVGVFPSTEAQHPATLAQRDRLVSINSAVEVDLTGQVNGEIVRGRQISGVGGSLDFVEGATHATGGRRIVALPSTTPDGSTSRIVPRLGADATVTIPKSMVEVVVTEHGVAHLEGRSARDRAVALVAIADPRHRDDLLEALR